MVFGPASPGGQTLVYPRLVSAGLGVLSQQASVSALGESSAGHVALQSSWKVQLSNPEDLAAAVPSTLLLDMI